MKIAETRKASVASPVKVGSPASDTRCSTKIGSQHLGKLAIVYVRQSSAQQVMENRESRERQYALTGCARALGWQMNHILVIDEDQGQSGARADNRSGFQQLLAEVTMDHVGIVLALEMSRLARSSKDWHHLLEVCAVFGTLLADQDGVYDASDPNDRLLLGLKGTISEVELHTMHNRMVRGALNKAQRGELFYGVPFGYVITANGEVAFDPDEQARSVVHLIFRKFDELGTINALFHWLVDHNILLPIRPRSGRQKGELQWRRASHRTLQIMLHHPIYAGAYSFGRRVMDRKSRYAGGKPRQVLKPMHEWKVLIQDRLPAYITWDDYLQNQRRIQQNHSGNGSPGAVRKGQALLGGVLSCGACGRRMSVLYRTKRKPYYQCTRHQLEYTKQTCYGLRSKEIDALISQCVLRALEPAALELSTKALAEAEQERGRLDKHWRQHLERARYESDLAQRRYRSVDPENRLVAATLERQWEDSLQKERSLEDEYDRFQQRSPAKLTRQERDSIRSLASDIPALWAASGTTNADRKEIIRCLIEKIVVHVRCNSESVDATVHWAGGYVSQHEFSRAVQSYSQLQDSEALVNRLVELRESKLTASQIADELNREGFSPPRRRGAFNRHVVVALLKHHRLIGVERSHDELLGQQEWWLVDLARELKMEPEKLRYWVTRGWLHGRKTPIQGYWILWADDDELRRLRTLLANSRRGATRYPSRMTAPKSRMT